MTKMIPPKGLKEVAVRTERGEKVYRAGRDGLINVENPKHAAQMRASRRCPRPAEAELPRLASIPTDSHHRPEASGAQRETLAYELVTKRGTRAGRRDLDQTVGPMPR